MLKKATGATDNGEDIYDVGNVRPLNVTNADNRLIASAVRLAIEQPLGRLLTQEQRVFCLGGRWCLT